eukprot:CAMPEP_0196587332 /NCGR_PEP_ID=MMETSP1081-20130531/57144_1 /TAXON_ID=36882 /ORGANISM="Pyramimonas amylifera, Strain CCMP720" /LENGTH=137 /DNA_ID=CAMNT_0041909487 /DNA_START=306 /DNA_END=716 /DNA_ORIENTATION=+
MSNTSSCNHERLYQTDAQLSNLKSTQYHDDSIQGFDNIKITPVRQDESERLLRELKELIGDPSQSSKDTVETEVRIDNDIDESKLFTIPTNFTAVLGHSTKEDSGMIEREQEIKGDPMVWDLVSDEDTGILSSIEGS